MEESRVTRWIVIGTILTAAVCASAGERSTTALSDLEAQLAAQQQRIDQLEQQLTAAAALDQDQSRNDMMKQQIREVLSEQEFRESLMPSTLQAGYDNGFFIRSSDDDFMIKFNGLMQMRYTYYETRGRNHYLLPGFDTSRNRSGFDAQRVDLAISGYAYSKDLTYNIELQSGVAGTYDTGVKYAWANYRMSDELQFRAGIMNIASMRSATQSFGAYQMAAQPLADAVFGLGDGAGLRVWGKLMDGKGYYYFDVVNSLGSPATRTITNDETLYTQGHDNNPAFAFRTVWALMGGMCQNPNDEPEFTKPCDFMTHDEPALNVGFHYAFTEDTHDGTLAIPYTRPQLFRPGGFGLTSSDGLQIHQAGVDMGFDYMGFSATAEYVVRLLDVRQSDHASFTPLYLLTGDKSTNMQHGGYLTCGYFLPIPGWERKFEVVGRVGGVWAVAGGDEGTWEYAGGLNYYINGQNVKLQTDVTHVSELPTTGSAYSYANVNDDAWIWRVQLQLAF